jgi:3-oxoacyl-[acyl-carrier protein] reductase
MGQLKGKTAIVTGAASGIGRATAQLFAAEGARVLAVDVNAAVSEIDNARIESLQCDLSNRDAPEKVLSAVRDMIGSAETGLDILMNNAGVGSNAPADQMSYEEWDRVLNINLSAPFRLAQRAIPELRKSTAGRIINVASVMATHTDYGLAAYCAAKAGITGFTRNLALELGRDNITVNAILPGAIHTGMTAASFRNAEIAAVWAKKSVLRRLGHPEDIAKVATFLASDASAFVTGQSINVDGGLLLRS